MQMGSAAFRLSSSRSSTAEFIGPGPTFDARAGRLISSPAVVGQSHHCQHRRRNGCGSVERGLKFTPRENQGQSSPRVQGMKAAMNEKASLIGCWPKPIRGPGATGPRTTCRGYSGGAVALQRQGAIGAVRKHAVIETPIDYFKADALPVDWAVVQTRSNMNVLLLISAGALSTDSTVAGSMPN
jgi:hypothetical protein